MLEYMLSTMTQRWIIIDEACEPKVDDEGSNNLVQVRGNKTLSTQTVQHVNYDSRRGE